MSLRFEYRVGDQKHKVSLAMADFDLIHEAIVPVLGGEISTIMDTHEFGVAVEVSTKDVITAIDKVVDWVKANPEKMPYTYQMKLVGGYMDDNFSTGGYGGLQLPDDDDDEYYYSVSAGCNVCSMNKLEVDKVSGVSRVVETIDLREKKTIETSNMGTLHIRKRKARSKLIDEFLSLREFLDSQDAELATKIIG